MCLREEGDSEEEEETVPVSRVLGPTEAVREHVIPAQNTGTFYLQTNAGKWHLFDLQGYCRTGQSNMAVAMEMDLH